MRVSGVVATLMGASETGADGEAEEEEMVVVGCRD